mmetsp:Transcript_43672/g.65950  ORF Transcript_43672/g.65950 Transcript_43672/m.65950 type:complete len:290 (-) Transcript_43672:101-970(-)
MRHGRAKLARRTLQFYRLNTQSVHSPYKVLVDGTFLVASIKQKVPLKERFEKTLQHESFTFYIARSTLDELKSLIEQMKKQRNSIDEETLEALEQARQFGLDECEILETSDVQSSSYKDDKKDSSSSEDGNARNDIATLSTKGGSNENGYFVATQDDELSDTLRTSPFVPLFRLGRGVLLLEGPSSASRSYASRMERDKERAGGGLVTEEERDAVQKAKERERAKARKKAEAALAVAQAAAAAENGAFQTRRKNKAKQPNPLSCKKRKGADDGGEKKKKKRKRKKTSDA